MRLKNKVKIRGVDMCVVDPYKGLTEKSREEYKEEILNKVNELLELIHEYEKEHIVIELPYRILRLELKKVKLIK